MAKRWPYWVKIRWGTDTTQVEVYEQAKCAPDCYEFGTLAELNAFMDGVEAGAGWLDYTTTAWSKASGR